MKENIKVNTAKALFWVGFYWFKFFGFTPKYSYKSLRKLFYTSNTEFNKEVRRMIAVKCPKYEMKETSGILGDLSTIEVKQFAEQISKYGFYKFEKKLDNETLENLKQFSLRTEALLKPPVENVPKSELFDRENPKTIKYQFMEQDLINNRYVQEIMTDEGLIAIAQEYLGTKPILDMITMWWSTSLLDTASSEVAQLYHFDMERISFIKFFFYLTDVDTNTGPHCYIKGTNNGFKKEVRRDGRISDEEIEKYYSKDEIVEITGPKGTILAVDTSGFHKGKKLLKDDRLLLQIEFTNSLFGVKNEYFKISNPSERILSSAKKYSETFKRYSF